VTRNKGAGNFCCATQALRVACVAAFALIGSPSAAYAQCGGGSGGGGGGGGGGDSGGDSSSTEAAPVCTDSSNAVGFAHCRRFAQEWNVDGLPSIGIGLGFVARQLRLSGAPLAGETEHDGNPHTFSVGEGEIPTGAASFGVALRLLVGLQGGVYVGGEVSFTGAPLDGSPITRGDLVVTPDGVISFEAAGFAGVGLSIGDIAIRAEVLAGMRWVGVSTTTTLGACTSHATAGRAAAVIEPRVFLELWQSPWVAWGGYVGHDVMGSDAWSGGLFVTAHARSYAGLTLP
jgi:hypothetical protein